MNLNKLPWTKPLLTLGVLGLLAWLTPSQPIDPWKILSPQKMATMVFALAAIQAISILLTKTLGTRLGSLFSGFLGGLISSTATAASLAKKSQSSPRTGSGEILIFLSATAAMLFEGLAIVIAGTSKVHLSHAVIFMGPLVATFVMIIYHYRNLQIQTEDLNNPEFEIRPLLKLSLFIIVILAVSKICQNLLGQNGLLALTSLVSLFEIHGSVIANVQLHESGAVSTLLLSSLLSVSVVASYISKLFLIATLGSNKLKVQALKCTSILFGTLALSWILARSLLNH